jgi:hypothetical protein
VVEKNNWLTYNNYRQNVQGATKVKGPGADLTARKHVLIDKTSDCKTRWVLWAEICNRGAALVKKDVPGTFYRGDPRKAGTALCTAKTGVDLAPGQCTPVSCDYKSPTRESIDLWFAADDNGNGKGPIPECKEKNNLLHLPGSSCPGNPK